MSAPSASASASSLPPDSRPGSSLRRLGQLRSTSQTYLSPNSSSNNNNNNSSSRLYRNPLTGRISSSSTHPNLSSVGGLPVPCGGGQTDQSSTISRYRQVLLGCYRDVGVDLRASSPDSLVSVSSDESDGENRRQETMARLRRSRTPSQNASQTPDPSSLRPDNRDPPEEPGRSSTTRPRSSTTPLTAPPPPEPEPASAENTNTPENRSTPETTSKPGQKATIRFYPYQDLHRNTRPSLQFIPVSRTLPSESSVIRVGRYSERDGVPVANPGAPSDSPVGFKSKVVSRRHCEFLYVNGQWHVKDVGSSSGTFLNHMRLSQPTMVSRLYPIKDGDIVQLGIDFRGGEEMIFRCVRMRIECNRSWQQQPNEFNKNTESLIKNLGKGDTADYSGCRECSICLGSVLRPYQCLFMAACAHVWHYKCVSPLIHSPEYPMFQCPNCRAYTDLSAEVDDSNDFDDTEQKESIPEEQLTPEEPRSEPEEPRAEPETNTGPEQPVEPEAGHEFTESPSGDENSRPEGSAPHSVPERQSESDASRPEPESGRVSQERQTEPSSTPETTHASDSSEGSPAPPAAPAPPTHAPPEPPTRIDRLTSPTLEEALAINFDNLGVRDSLFRTVTEATHSPSSREPTPTNGNLASGDNLVPGWQTLGPDTPVRSESTEENPLTPRNDSGPLAFDGRAGVHETAPSQAA